MSEQQNEASAAAVILGRMNKGVPKTLSPEERERRAEAARQMTVKRVAGQKAIRQVGQLTVVPDAPQERSTLVSIRG